MKKYKILIYIYLIVTILLATKDTTVQFIEDLDIASGGGFDIKTNDVGEIMYDLPISMYIFENEKSVESQLFSGRGKTIAKAREDRQKSEGKKFLTGSKKVNILSEKYAKNGIKNMIDYYFLNPTTQDFGVIAVCKDNPVKMLNTKIEGYPSSSDFIEKLIRNSVNFNFFPDEYKFLDIIIKPISEGRNLSLPYIELENNQIKLSGLVIFNNFKMVEKLNMKDSKIMNILKEDTVKGTVSIIKNSREYVECYCITKRKVKCVKNEDNYNFIISVNIIGEISDNELYPDLTNKIEVKEKLEKDLAKKFEADCYKFINKMNTKYQIDMIELGRVAAATYGRKTGTDWNKVISKSNIKVNVKLKINKFGRGDY